MPSDEPIGHRAKGAVVAAAGALALLLAPPAPATAVAPAFEPSPVQHVLVGGEPFGYRTVGSGPPLVMVMGFSGTMAEWDPALVALLAREHRVIVFDNRGVAESGAASVRGLSIERMASDTATIIRKLTPRGRAEVLGWSMGAFITQELALRHPRRVHRAIIAAGDPGGPRAIQPRQRVVEILNDPETTPGDLIPILFPRGQRDEGRAWFARVSRWGDLGPQAFEVSTAALEAQIRAEGPDWYGPGDGVLGRLHEIDQRVLVADGREDIVEPPANSRLIARRLPNARLRLFDDAGHAFLIQRRVLFAAVVERFLAR